MSKYKILGLVGAVIIIILLIVGFLIFTQPSEEIGSNNLGYVEKISYDYYGNAPVKIVIISGMHSRETLHKSVLPLVASTFALTHNCKVINYKVTVTNHSEDFTIGRANGEQLVHDFVVDDLKKEGGANLTIIGHDHEDGYGSGYYVATPTMDNVSVSLAESVTPSIHFNHYKRDTSVVSQSTSINNVDYPILNAGSPVFVYEIPENDNFVFAFIRSFTLLESSYNHLVNN